MILDKDNDFMLFLIFFLYLVFCIWINVRFFWAFAIILTVFITYLRVKGSINKDLLIKKDDCIV